jgi:hypothetical protein
MPSVRWSRRVSAVGLAMVAVPFVAVVALALTRPWSSSTDLALMELRTLDVGGPATPLVGPYSRFGWYHPGPLAFWILALPYRLAGGRPVGLLVGTAAVHAAAVAACLVLARRRGGRALAGLTGLFLALLLAGFGARVLVNFWNPYLPLLALVFLVLATWSVIEGDVGLLPAIVAVSCFAWQSHLSYLPVTATLVVVGAAGAAHRLGRAGRRRGLALASITAVTAAVCLAPILVEQRAEAPGNARLIVETLRHPPAPMIGTDRAARIVARQLGPAAPWLRGEDGDSRDEREGIRAGEAPTLLLALPLAVVVALAIASVRMGAAAAARLLGLTALCAGIGLLTVARTAGEPFTYLVAWLRPLAMTVWLAAVWAAVCVVRARAGIADRRSRAVASTAVAGATVAAVLVAVAGRPLTLPEDGASQALQVLGPAAVTAAAGQPRVRRAMSGGWCAGELGTGVGAQLAEHGTDVEVDERAALPFGRQRGGTAPAPAVEVVCGAGTADHIARSPLRPLATAGLLATDELVELRRLQDDLRAQLRALDRADLADVVDNQAFVTVDDLARSGVALDPRVVERFTTLMDRSRFSGAVFYRPDGLVP